MKKKEKLVLKRQKIRLLETDDNQLSFTVTKGKLPRVDFSFQPDKLQQHLQLQKINSQSKKIQKWKRYEYDQIYLRRDVNRSA